MNVPRLPDPPEPPDPTGVRATLRLRQQMREVSERIAALESEQATLVELRERLRADERARQAALATIHQECEELARMLVEETRRAAAIEAEIRAAAEENTALESADRTLEQKIELAQRDARAAANRLTAREEQRSAAEGAIADARGALARMQQRLRYGFAADLAAAEAGEKRKPARGS